MLKKIVILGPESTGKSTLCEQLAAHYDTLWCPEYAREYLLEHGMDYTFDDLLTIAKGQLKMEEKYETGVRSRESGTRKLGPGVGSRESERTGKLQVKGKKSKSGSNHSLLPTDDSSLTSPDSLLFVDTDMYVMKVWCEFVFGDCHRFILDQIVERKYDLYLLCNIDLPWVKDELREYPDLESRRQLYAIYKDIMINQSTPWIEISGDYDERLKKAISRVDALLV